MVKRELSAETIDRLRTWMFFGVIVCAGLIIGLSNSVWSDPCANSTVLSFLRFITVACPVTGGESQVVFGFGDGLATLALGLALLATCALGFAFSRSRGMWMVFATMIGLAVMAIVASASIEYEGRGTLGQSLMLLTGASIAAPLLSALFVWLDIKHEQATMNGSTETWA